MSRPSEDGTIQDGTGAAVIEHWKRMADRHIVNENTAGALRAACAKVLGLLGDDWRTADLSTLDVDDILMRFENKHHKDMTPQSVATYKSRFKTALNGYLEYLENPSGWRPKASKSKVRNRQDTTRAPRTENIGYTANGRDEGDDGIDSPDTLTHRFPLNDGSLATLVLPLQLRKVDVKRLTALLDALAFEDDKAPPPKALPPGPGPEVD